MRQQSKKSVVITILLVMILLAGIGIMLYPTISDWWNLKTQSRVIATYVEQVDDLSTEDYEAILQEARAYNEKLSALETPLYDYEQVAGYESILDITGTGIMGYVTIPTIDVQLPIYHGTSAEVLNIAIGHLQGTSLPVGGMGTHSVIMAHRGLPSAKLFSDLDELAVGDTFTVTVLNEVLTYEVCDIAIVLPDEIEKLAIEPGEDYVTLMTCTPYGVNTHRLLVRGKRIETDAEAASQVRVTADANQVDPMIVVPVIAAPFVLILICIWVFGGKKRRRRIFWEGEFNEKKT
jgi:sortase A